MKCVEVQKQIDLMLDDELNLPQKKQIGQHLEICPSCQKSYQVLQKTKDSLKNQPNLLPTAFLDQNILQAFAFHHQSPEKVGFWQKFSLPIPAMATISALFIFSLFGAFWLGRTTAQPKVVTETVTIEKTAPTVETRIFESPKPEIITVTKYIKVPVMKEKEVVKVVQTEKSIQKTQVVKAKGNLLDYADKTNALVTKIDLDSFQPTSELNIRIVKKGDINE